MKTYKTERLESLLNTLKCMQKDLKYKIDMGDLSPKQIINTLNAITDFTRLIENFNKWTETDLELEHVKELFESKVSIHIIDFNRSLGLLREE